MDQRLIFQISRFFFFFFNNNNNIFYFILKDWLDMNNPLYSLWIGHKLDTE